MIEIVSLSYSYSKNDFRLEPSKPKRYVPLGFELIAAQIDRKDAEMFIHRMHSKYVKGRKRGRYPTSDIVKLELELFVKLKDYPQKLV